MDYFIDLMCFLESNSAPIHLCNFVNVLDLYIYVVVCSVLGLLIMALHIMYVTSQNVLGLYIERICWQL